MPYTLVGLLVGALLSLLGLWLTRWETTEGVLFLTPNRWLILLLTVLVADSALAGSLAAAGVLLGYSIGYWFGVRRRLAALAG
ncbi:MAG: hypothetical protein DWQ36_20600 [Acidobacteria bacterium]|nr:MAG: hypothetical protein DWQ30_21025 [Acidobacteriota bacterium]REK03271.1 MAG: hypothetical protein DWQ36_20600 [Acidobacteriota bacterium]